MYGSFEGWYHSNKRPWETRSDAKARYESVYGKDDEELEVVDTPAFSYEPEEVEEEEAEGFLDETGEWFSDLGTGLGRGFDQLQATGGTLISDYVAGALPESLKEYEQPLTDLGDEIYYRNIKEAKEDWGPRKPSRLEQSKLDDPNYQRALSKEEFIKQNPDHWKSKIYRKFPDWLPSWEKFKETAPTAEELGEMIPTSITPSIAGRTAGGFVGSVGGPVGTFGGQMAGGASASSAMTASEVSREIRDNPTVRKTIGLDPDVSYQDDSYENKNKMQRLAKLVFRNSFANRLTSSGIPEMAGYAAFGKGLTGVMSRAATDVVGGTWSELWDLDMSRRSIVESLKEFAETEGKPLSEQQLAQIHQTLYEMGPKKREIFSQAFVSELLLGGPGSMVELGLEVRRDHRVDEVDTDTAEMEKMKKEIEKEDSKRLEIVGGPFAEIEALYDQGKEEEAHEVYQTINKENRKQNALSDLLQKKRYDIYKDFLDRDSKLEAVEGEMNEAVDTQINAIEELEKAEAKAIEKTRSEAEKKFKNLKKFIEGGVQGDQLPKIRKALFGIAKALGIERAETDTAGDLYTRINESLGLGIDEDIKTEETTKTTPEKPPTEETTTTTKTTAKETTTKKTAAKKTPPPIQERVKKLIETPPKSKTKELQAVAKEVGVRILKKDTPTDVVNKIKKKAMGEPETTDTKKTEQKVPVTVKPKVTTVEPESPLQELRDYYDDTSFSKKYNRGKNGKTLTSLEIQEDGKTIRTFSRKELKELGAITENMYGQENVHKGSIPTEAPTTKPTTTAKDTTKTTPKIKAPKKAKEVDFTKVDDLSDEDVNTIIDIVGEERIPVRSVFTEDVPGRLSVLDETYPNGMTANEMAMEEMSIQEEKNRIKNEPINEQIQIENEKRLAEGKDEKPFKSDDLTDSQLDSAQNRGEKNFAKAVRKIQAEQLAAKKDAKKTTPKGKREALKDAQRKVETKKGSEKANAVNKFVESGVKKRLKANPKATVETQNQWRTELTTEFLNKESSAKLAEKKKADEEAEAKKQKDWKKTEDKTATEPITDGQVVSSATGRTRKKSKRTRQTDAPGLSKEGVQSAIDTFKKNSNQKIKDINITTLSRDDEADVEILREIIGAEFDTLKLETDKEQWVNNKIEAVFSGTEAFVDNRNGDVYVIADQIFADTGSATDRLTQVLFHELLGHVGLRQTLGKEAYKTFINRFLKTNKKVLKKWATEGTGQVYLPKVLRGKDLKTRQNGFDKMSNDQKFVIAEEYIATRFAEHGARDPNIIDRIAVHIARALNKQGIYDKMSVNEVKMTLAEIQQDYIGGNRNFITGENFRSVPMLHYDDDVLEEQAQGEAVVVEGEEGEGTVREVGLLSDEELEAHMASQASQGISKSVRIPKKTIKKVYKLMDIRDGQLYYPFVEEKGKDKLKSKPQYPVELGEWLSAKFVLPKDMPGRGRGMKLSPRGGFHLTENLTPHLKTKLKDGTTRVWVEVEIGDDVNYQNRVGEKGRDTEFLVKRDKDGNVIDGKVPEGGQYRFKRPAREGGWWRIAGEMRLLRILPESESNTLLNEYVASKEYTDALAKKAPKKQVKEPITLSGISRSIKLYHGSPKRFNKFITDHVGHGAHGWGLYFSDYKSIAKIYSQPKGYLYNVNIPPKINEFLDLNKSFNDQSEYVKTRLKKLLVEDGTQKMENFTDPNFKEGFDRWTGRDIYQWGVGKFGDNQKKASQYFSVAGIKGNKSSPTRFAKKGSKIYVVYNADDVLIESVTDEKTGKVETTEGKMLRGISQSKSLGMYAKYNKDAGVKGTMLLHENTRPNEGEFRITFFKEDGELDMDRTENKMGHEHFPTLDKAEARLKKVGEDIQDISGGRAISRSVRKTGTFREELAKAEGKRSLSRAMRRIKELGKISPLNNKEIIIGETAVEIQPHMDGESLWFKSIRAFGKGKGQGTETMNKILKIAKEEEINLRGTVKAFEAEGMSTQQLRKWYTSLGSKAGIGYQLRGNEIIYEGKPEEIVISDTSKMKSIDISPKAKADQVSISPEAKRRWELSSISFSKRLRRDEMPQGTIIRDRVLLDMSKIKGLSNADIKKISSGNGPFIFMWDRMRGDGFYETPSGVRIPLQGGMANSYLTYNMEAGIIGSSTSAGVISDVITSRVKESNGYGLVGLMTPEAHGSNPTFFTIYTQVIRDVLGTKGAERTALENKFAELIKSGPIAFRKPFETADTTKGTRGDQRSNEVLKKINNAKTPKQKYKIFEEEGKKLTFEARKKIFNGLGGENISAELGIPSFQKMLIDTIDPEFGPKPGQSWANFKGKTGNNNTGNLVQVMKFNKDKPLSTAEAEGLAKKHAHLSYDISFMGKVLGRFKGKGIPLLDATNPFYEGDPSLGIKPYRSNEGNLIRTEKRQGTTMMKMPVFAKGIPQSQRQTFFKKYSGKVKVKDTEGGALTYTKVMKDQFSPETMLKPTKRNRTKSALSASKRLISQSVNYSNSRADNYESTRVASQGRGPLTKLARKLTRRLISQGTLNDFALYKELRRKTKGTILRLEQVAENFYKVIKNSKQQKEIYDYFTTPNADRTKITDPEERRIVVEVKKEIMKNGEALVSKYHLMTRKTLEKLDDQYLPRKYLKYLLRDSDYNLLSKSDSNLASLDLSYLNKRQDIEKGVRELILGEVKDPAFLSATAFATPRKDMALLDFMEQIASDVGVKRGWVLPKTLVTFDTMGLMKQLAGESPETRSLIEELELMETKGARVSGHWLINEAERIQNLATDHMELTPEKTLLVKKLTDRMSKAGKKIVGDVVPKDYIRVPKGRKYGRLQGMAIRKEIFEDLFGWTTGTNQTFNINDDGTVDRNIAEKILGTGGTFEQFNRFWKWSKVSANPPSWVRNFISNLIFMNMGPVPLHRMPDLFVRSLTDQITTRIKLAKGDKKNEVYDKKGNPLTDTARADMQGLTSGGFSQVELKMIKSNFEEAVRRGDPQEGIAGLMTIRNAFRGIGKEETVTGKAKALAKAGLRDPFVKYVQTPTSDLYGGIDTLGKVMMMKYLHGDHQINPKTGRSFNQGIFGYLPLKEGKKPAWEGGERHYTAEEAAAEAEKWLFDYSNPLPSVKYLRKSAFGAPFLSYPSFVAPLIIETALTRPWKFIPHILFGEAMILGFKSVYDISDEEYEAVIDESNDYIKKRAKGGYLDKVPDFVPIIGGTPWIPRTIIPVFNPFSKEKNLDENGRAQLLDIGYLQPYGMFSDIFRQLDPTKDTGIEPAQALHTFGLLSSPLINISTTILTNRDPFTDREIYDEFATGTEKLGAWGHYLWNLSMPPMVHGFTQRGEGKGFGAFTRLWEHYFHTVTKEGEAKHTQTQALWRAIGINITPIAPHEARGVNAQREVAKINRLKRRIKNDAEKAFFNGVSIKDIDEMIREDVKKMEDLADALDKRLGTPLPAVLKRTEKQRLKILNEFLKKRKAS